MPKYYMTFGAGQALAGRVLPIIANDIKQARDYMTENFGGKWSTSYTEERWQAWKKQAKTIGIPVETELDTVDISNEVQIDG